MNRATVTLRPPSKGEGMNKIRVLLANHPKMVPDAIRHLVMAQEDMEVVGDCRGPMKTLQETGRTKADAVILTQEGTTEPGLCSQLLAVYPDLTILSVTPDMSIAATYQLCSRRRNVMSLQSNSLVQMLRMTIRYPCNENNAG
jgi:DNA-binding NarL/FixJ family response regulator